MTILQQPDALSLSQNLKEFHISSDVQVSFILKQGGVEILSQRYDPSADGHITINLRDIVHARLSYQLIESGQVLLSPGFQPSPKPPSSALRGSTMPRPLHHVGKLLQTPLM